MCSTIIRVILLQHHRMSVFFQSEIINCLHVFNFLFPSHRCLLLCSFPIPSLLFFLFCPFAISNISLYFSLSFSHSLFLLLSLSLYTYRYMICIWSFSVSLPPSIVSSLFSIFSQSFPLSHISFQLSFSITLLLLPTNTHTLSLTHISIRISIKTNWSDHRTIDQSQPMTYRNVPMYIMHVGLYLELEILVLLHIVQFNICYY